MAVFVWYLDTRRASQTERLDMLGCVCLVSGHKESELDWEIGHWLGSDDLLIARHIVWFVPSPVLLVSRKEASEL